MPVALQIREVPESLRDVLAAQAAAAGQSLQAYLLALLEREARFIDNLAILTEPLPGAAPHGDVDVAATIRSERAAREDHLVRAFLDRA